MEESNTAGEPLPGLAASADRAAGVESAYAWLRLAAALAISTIGTVGMWSGVVALPALQAEFGVARADASLPYTLTMIAFGFGGILMGRFADRFGVVVRVFLFDIQRTFVLFENRSAGSSCQFYRDVKFVLKLRHQCS